MGHAPPNKVWSRLEVVLQMPAMSAVVPGQVCQVFGSQDVFVALGVNLDEGLAGLEDACLGDIYLLAREAVAQKLVLRRGGDGQKVADGSALGISGAQVSIAARYTLMTPDGDKVELLALRVSAESGFEPGYFILPLSPIGPQIEYTLVKVEEPKPQEWLMDLM